MTTNLSSDGVSEFPKAAPVAVDPGAALHRSVPPIGNSEEETLAAKALRWELAAGNLRRDLDEIRVELRRLSRDRCPEPDEYPEALYEVAEKLRSLIDRL